MAANNSTTAKKDEAKKDVKDEAKDGKKDEKPKDILAMLDDEDEFEEFQQDGKYRVGLKPAHSEL